jgi:hypothetical protein
MRLDHLDALVLPQDAGVEISNKDNGPGQRLAESRVSI